MLSTLTPTAPTLLLELSRARNNELARENARLRDELTNARMLLDEALALAAAVPPAAPPAAPAPAVQPATTTSRRNGGALPSTRAASTSCVGRSASATVSATGTASAHYQRPQQLPPPAQARGISTGAHASSSGKRSTPAAPSAKAEQQEQQRQAALAARQAVATRRAERAAAAVTLQAVARGIGTRAALQQQLLEQSAALRMQAVVRGNAARGIAERRRYELPASPPRRLVHPPRR